MRVKKFADKIFITDEYKTDEDISRGIHEELYGGLPVPSDADFEKYRRKPCKIAWSEIRNCTLDLVLRALFPKLFHVKHSKKGGKK